MDVSPDVMQFFAMLLITLYYIVVATIREFKSSQPAEVEEMVIVINWERVAELEHEFGFDHIDEVTKAACRHEECYTPPPVPTPQERLDHLYWHRQAKGVFSCCIFQGTTVDVEISKLERELNGDMSFGSAVDLTHRVLNGGMASPNELRLVAEVLSMATAHALTGNEPDENYEDVIVYGDNTPIRRISTNPYKHLSTAEINDQDARELGYPSHKARMEELKELMLLEKR